MSELNFDTGLVTYKVNGQCEISFNPADVAFVKRLFNTFDGLSKQQEDIDVENKEIDGSQLFELVEQRDKKILTVFSEKPFATRFSERSVFLHWLAVCLCGATS